MAEFNAADAALEGFSIVRRRPQLVPIWAAFQLALGLVMGLLGIALGGEALTEFLRLQGTARQQDQGRVLELVGELLPFLAAAGVVGLGAGSVFATAVFRAVLRPEDGGPGFFRLGADEVRVLLSYLGVLLATVVVTFAVVLVLAIASAALALVSRPLGAVLVVMTALAPLILLIAAFTRFSLALPQAFAERRVSVLGGWRLSRKRFWPLFGMLVLAVVLALVIYISVLLVYWPVGAILGGGLRAAGEPMQPSYDSLSDWFSPAMAAYLLIVIGFGGALMNAVLVAPLAHAYRDLKRSEADPRPA